MGAEDFTHATMGATMDAFMAQWRAEQRLADREAAA